MGDTDTSVKDTGIIGAENVIDLYADYDGLSDADVVDLGLTQDGSTPSQAGRILQEVIQDGYVAFSEADLLQANGLDIIANGFRTPEGNEAVLARMRFLSSEIMRGASYAYDGKSGTWVNGWGYFNDQTIYGNYQHKLDEIKEILSSCSWNEFSTFHSILAADRSAENGHLDITHFSQDQIFYFLDIYRVTSRPGEQEAKRSINEAYENLLLACIDTVNWNITSWYGYTDELPTRALRDIADSKQPGTVLVNWAIDNIANPDACSDFKDAAYQVLDHHIENAVADSFVSHDVLKKLTEIVLSEASSCLDKTKAYSLLGKCVTVGASFDYAPILRRALSLYDPNKGNLSVEPARSALKFCKIYYQKHPSQKDLAAAGINWNEIES